MRAIFIHANCILRDSHIDPQSPGEGWRLTPATLEALRRLSSPDQLLIVLDDAVDGDGSEHLSRVQAELVSQVEAGGGHLDAVVNCPHRGEDVCRCWGSYPGILWLPALQLDLDLPACFVIADGEREIETAYSAQVRPIMILAGRQIAEVIGLAPMHKDFPIAPDLTTAVSYIAVEQEIAQTLGHPRSGPAAIPQPALLGIAETSLPALKVTSARLAALRSKQLESRIKMKDLARWLSFFIIGAIGVTLGIAYLLTHLYRVQPFPDFVYWLTLQFIPRPLRGLLFIVIGLIVIVLAARGFYHSDFARRALQHARNNRH